MPSAFGTAWLCAIMMCGLLSWQEAGISQAASTKKAESKVPELSLRQDQADEKSTGSSRSSKNRQGWSAEEKGEGQEWKGMKGDRGEKGDKGEVNAATSQDNKRDLMRRAAEARLMQTQQMPQQAQHCSTRGSSKENHRNNDRRKSAPTPETQTPLLLIPVLDLAGEM